MKILGLKWYWWLLIIAVVIFLIRWDKNRRKRIVAQKISELRQQAGVMVINIPENYWSGKALLEWAKFVMPELSEKDAGDLLVYVGSATPTQVANMNRQQRIDALINYFAS